MNRCTRLICCFICLIILSATACSMFTEQPTQLADQLPASTKTVVSLSTSLPVLVYSPMPDSHTECHTQICRDSVPAPTIIPANQKRFFELLESNGNCELPCFLGITPGTTKWAVANDILKPFVFRNPILYDETRRTQTNRTYRTQINTEVNQDVLVSMTMGLDIGVDQNDIVQHIIMRTELYGDGFTEFNDNHLLPYSLHEIFLRKGKPDFIYLFHNWNGYEFRGIYNKLKMAVIFGGNYKKTLASEPYICPNFGDGQVRSMMLVLASPSDTVDVKELIGYPVDNAPTLEEATGLRLEDFYRLIVGDQQPACFQIK